MRDIETFPAGGFRYMTDQERAAIAAKWYAKADEESDEHLSVIYRKTGDTIKDNAFLRCWGDELKEDE